MPRFKTRFPPRFAKHKQRFGKWSAASSRSGTDDDYDVEKSTGPSDHDRGADSDSSSPSSPTTPDSYAPMLARPRAPIRTASAYQQHKHDRRRCNKYFTLALLSLLVIFILTLTRMSHQSREEVEIAPPPPPKAPLYESFTFLTRYYGGIQSLVSRSENKPEYPDTEVIMEMLEGLQNSSSAANQGGNGIARRAVDEESGGRSFRKPLPSSRPFNPFNEAEDSADIVECFLDEKSTMTIPKVHAYDGVMKGFPDHITGSFDMLGLNSNVCFDRYGRFGPYGFGYSTQTGGIGAGFEGDTEGSGETWNKTGQIDYRGIQWADLQDRCMRVNQHRFGLQHSHSTSAMSWSSHGNGAAKLSSSSHTSGTDRGEPETIPRQAVIIRTWADYPFDGEDIANLRALIAELSLTSGTQYVVHFLIHVKDTDLPIWSDEEVHQRVLNESLPEEFRGMGTLWSEKQMALIYAGLNDTNFRDLGVYGVYRSTFMPMQYFAHQHPEYDFFWHWELDIRYTGHYLHLFNQAGKWAKQQPRKGLWERNARFYVPSEHGSWEDFQHMVRVQTEHGTNSKSNLWTKFGGFNGDNLRANQHLQKPIWGPQPPADDQLDHENDPKPPTTSEKDKYTWGVGEDADLITFNPLFDPDQTGWLLADDVTGYNTERALPPRRASIITATRLSRRLLDTMHRETALKKHTMFSEMWPSSCALHHGLKAVYVPHPVYIDRMWPTDFLAATFNGGLNGASGGARTSPFNEFNQRNFLGVTWYYHAGFAPNLFKRWLGFNIDGIGGPEWETQNPGEGRMCLPAMLIHPVKQVDLLYENLSSDEEGLETAKDLLEGEFLIEPVAEEDTREDEAAMPLAGKAFGDDKDDSHMSLESNRQPPEAKDQRQPLPQKPKPPLADEPARGLEPDAA